MEYNTIFAKSFSRHEQKKLGYGALLGCFIILVTTCTVFKPSFAHLPILNLRISMSTVSLRMLMIEDHTSSNAQRLTDHSTEIVKQVQDTQQPRSPSPPPPPLPPPPVCNVFEPRSDFCDIEGDIRVQGNSSTILFTSSSSNQMNSFRPENESSWKIRPYARKGDNAAMGHVNELSVKSFDMDNKSCTPSCTISQRVPAIIFSTGGYAGNHFHDFSDILVPLFLTSHEFNGEVQFLITNLHSYWISKYQAIFKHLSNYPIIDFDKENKTLCFSRVIVGLKYHKDLSMDPSKSPNGYSMVDFGQFLRNSYSLNRTSAIRLTSINPHKIKIKPRLLIVSRKKTRSFTNEDEIVKLATSLGYEAVVAEPGKTTGLSGFAEIVNSCDVMMGVHGAGLTNLVFLPTNAVLIQIIPLGGLEWLSRQDFGIPAMDMKLGYLEYKIKEEESTLIQQYPLDHAVFRDPQSIQKQGWEAIKSVYMNQQNVKLDVGRFRTTLLQALKHLHH